MLRPSKRAQAHDGGRHKHPTNLYTALQAFALAPPRADRAAQCCRRAAIVCREVDYTECARDWAQWQPHGALRGPGTFLVENRISLIPEGSGSTCSIRLVIYIECHVDPFGLSVSSVGDRRRASPSVRGRRPRCDRSEDTLRPKGSRAPDCLHLSQLGRRHTLLKRAPGSLPQHPSPWPPSAPSPPFFSQCASQPWCTAGVM